MSADFFAFFFSFNKSSHFAKIKETNKKQRNKATNRALKQKQKKNAARHVREVNKDILAEINKAGGCNWTGAGASYLGSKG